MRYLGRELKIPRQIQDGLQSDNTTSEQFLYRIIFMSMFNDIEWTKIIDEEFCTSNSQQVKQHAQRFQTGHWTFIGPGDERTWYGTRDYRPETRWNAAAAKLIRIFMETITPSSRVSVLAVVEF